MLLQDLDLIDLNPSIDYHDHPTVSQQKGVKHKFRQNFFLKSWTFNLFTNFVNASNVTQEIIACEVSPAWTRFSLWPLLTIGPAFLREAHSHDLQQTLKDLGVVKLHRQESVASAGTSKLVPFGQPIHLKTGVWSFKRLNNGIRSSKYRDLLNNY